MFSRVQKRFTWVNVAMTLALVFAMTGGAYAAKRYVITSTKQISPSVLKSLKGANGTPGATGLAGANGAAGAQGPQGPQGPKSEAGPEGKEGKQGEKGEKGGKGERGEPWSVGGTLPSGKTETGTWVYGPLAKGVTGAQVSVSIPVPLESGAVVHFHFIHEEAAPTTECPGSVEKPTAAQGNLCVYEVAGSGSFGSVGPFDPETSESSGFAGTTGVLLSFHGVEEESVARGDWAVTAP